MASTRPLFGEGEQVGWWKEEFSGCASGEVSRSLGNGMVRALGIALALVNAREGILLIDELENGLHYSVQTDIWRLIFRLAHQLNIQVFATTHSWDCIEGFQKAAQEMKNEEGILISLENRKAGVGAVIFNEEELRIVTREHIEVR